MRWLLFALLLVPAIGTSVVFSQIWNESWPFVWTKLGFLEAPEYLSLLIAGDIMLGRDVERRWTDEATDPLIYLQDLFSSYEDVLINFEAPIPSVHRPTPDFGFQFSVSPTVLPTLVGHNVSYAGLANNHTGDLGQVEFDHTVDNLRGTSITPIGTPYELASSSLSIIETEAFNIGVIAINLTAHEPEPDVVRHWISVLHDKEPDLSMAYVHWGTEYESLPDERQKRWAKLLADMRIDIVVGHHPHVVQSIERIDDTLVFYSLGNTVFDQYFSQATQQGLLLGLKKKKAGIWVEMYPITSEKTFHQPMLLQTEERKEFLDDLADISHSGLQSDIIKGEIRLP